MRNNQAAFRSTQKASDMRGRLAQSTMTHCGSKLTELHRQDAICAGSMARGEKPAELAGPTTDRVRIGGHVRAAQAFGSAIPLTLQLAAEEMIA